MPRISQVFGLTKTQRELDFADVELTTDNRLYIDPFALAQQCDLWSSRAAATLGAFFQRVIDDIRNGDENHALALLQNLHEPNETRLGQSQGRSQGAGVGPEQAQAIYEALTKSTAVRTGFITSLEECELMVPGISHDKISDLTTNVIRQHLVDYTLGQCQLHNIPVRTVPIAPCFNPDTVEWEEDYRTLPVFYDAPILFVPKAIVRYRPAYDADTYYRWYVLEFLRASELNDPRSRLVRTIKRTGTRVVLVKDLKSKYPKGKEFLLEFSRKHPDELTRYRSEMKQREHDRDRNDLDIAEDETVLAGALAEALRAISPGDSAASTYHRLMIGIVEFLFFPQLVHPMKEVEIHDGRKRIDIVMENAARSGIFYSLPTVRRIPSTFVFFECKNYGREIGNPELDQLTGRFSVNRGTVGVLCCRSFIDRPRFIRRCRDTFQDRRGLVIPLDDDTVIRMLGRLERGERNDLDRDLIDLFNEVMLA